MDSSIDAVLFDLDLTLLDSSSAEGHRRRRAWSSVYEMIPGFVVYGGVQEALDLVRSRGAKIGVVTSSPGSYCGRVVRHCGWVFDVVVCYHDTARHKPAPDPILKAVRDLGLTPDRAVYVGDDTKDVAASKAAGVVSIAATWGAQAPGALRGAGADYVCETPAELREVLARLL